MRSSSMHATITHKTIVNFLCNRNACIPAWRRVVNMLSTRAMKRVDNTRRLTKLKGYAARSRAREYGDIFYRRLTRILLSTLSRVASSKSTLVLENVKYTADASYQLILYTKNHQCLIYHARHEVKIKIEQLFATRQ